MIHNEDTVIPHKLCRYLRACCPYMLKYAFDGVLKLLRTRETIRVRTMSHVPKVEGHRFGLGYHHYLFAYCMIYAQLVHYVRVSARDFGDNQSALVDALPDFLYHY